MTTPLLSGSEIPVNVATNGSQLTPKVSQLSDGRSVFIWVDTTFFGPPANMQVLGQIIRADGSREGPVFTVNTQSLVDQLDCDVTTLANGNFVVTWVDKLPTFTGDGSSVKAQVFSSTGAKIGTEFLVNEFNLGDQVLPAITALSDGGFAITFKTAIDTIAFHNDATAEANVRIFNADGTARTGEFTANQLPLSLQGNPEITTLANGNILVVWEQAQFSTEPLPDTSVWGLTGRIFTPNGTAVTNDFPINTITDDQQQFVNVASLSGGGFVATWMDRSTSPDDPSGDAVRAQVFSNTGAKVGVEFLVNTTTQNSQYDPVVTGLSDGRFIIAWTDTSEGASSDIRAQLFNANGSKSGVEFLVNLNGLFQGNPTITELTDGRVMIGWHDGGDPTIGNTSAQIIDPREASVNFAGTSADDIFFGTRFGDTLSGGNGMDKIYGERGDDAITGGGGNDTLDGGTGADSLIGGSGNDKYYTDGLDALTEAINGGTDTVRSSATFTLGANFEHLILTGTLNRNGTGNALNNTLTGNSGNNVLAGAGGEDVLFGGKGSDTLTGGAKSDSFKFAIGDTGQSPSTIDRITDFTKGAVAVGDEFDFAAVLRSGGSAAAATATQASIHQATGVASFAAGSGTNFTDAVRDVEARIDAVGNHAGDFALFQIGGTGAFHLFVSDGVAGVTANDVVVQLTGITSIGSINLTGGDLTILT